jgi:hypothetical protein
MVILGSQADNGTSGWFANVDLKRSDASVPIDRNSPRGMDGRNLDTVARNHSDSKTPWDNISHGTRMLVLGKCSRSAPCMLLEED